MLEGLQCGRRNEPEQCKEMKDGRKKIYIQNRERAGLPDTLPGISIKSLSREDGQNQVLMLRRFHVFLVDSSNEALEENDVGLRTPFLRMAAGFLAGLRVAHCSEVDMGG